MLRFIAVDQTVRAQVWKSAGKAVLLASRLSRSQTRVMCTVGILVRTTRIHLYTISRRLFPVVRRCSRLSKLIYYGPPVDLGGYAPGSGARIFSHRHSQQEGVPQGGRVGLIQL